MLAGLSINGLVAPIRGRNRRQPLTFIGISGQSTDVWQHKDTNGNVISKLSQTGKLTIGTLSTSVGGNINGILELQYRNGGNGWISTIQQSLTAFSFRSNGSECAYMDVGSTWISGPLRSQGMHIGNTYGNRSTFYPPPTSGLRVEGQAVFGTNVDVAGSQVRIVPATSTTVGINLTLAASQSANALDITSSGGSAGDTFSISAGGNVSIKDGGNFVIGTTTGTIIGTSTSQKVGYWGATPIVQPTTAITGATLVSNGGTALTSTDTFDGYTIAQVVKALRNMGKLA